MFPKYCRDCTWSDDKIEGEYRLKCMNPLVNGSDNWSLGSKNVTGRDCPEERRESSFLWFGPKCGKTGKLWEQKKLDM